MKHISLALFFFLMPLFVYSQSADVQRFRLGETYEKGGDMENASRIFEELLKENPNNQNYFDALVRTFSSMNRYSELLPYVRDRYQKSQDIPTSVLYAELLWRTGTTSEANKVWEQAIRTFKDKPDVYVQISNSQVQLRLFDRAIAVLLDGRKNLSDNRQFGDALSRLYIAVGDYRRGTKEVIETFNHTGNLAVAQGRLYAMIADDESENFINGTLRKFASDNPDRIQAQELYAWFLRTINRLDQALDVFKNIDRLKRSNGADLFRFGEDSRRDGQYDIALQAFAVIIDMGKTNPYINSALFSYARTLEQKMLAGKDISKKQAEEIIARYNSIIKDFPNTQQASESRVRIAQIAANYLGDTKSAIEHLETAIKERQNTRIAASASIDLANIHINTENFDQAMTILIDTERRYKGNLPNFANTAKLLTAELLFFKGLIDSAMTFYAELSVAPETDIANQSLARIVVIEQNRQFVQGLVNYAAAEFDMRRNRQMSAAEKFGKAADIASGTDLAELSLRKKAEIEFNNQKYDASVATLKMLLKDYPDTIFGDFALLLLGDNYVALNRMDDAVASYTEILMKYPRSIYISDARAKIRQLRDAL